MKKILPVSFLLFLIKIVFFVGCSRESTQNVAVVNNEKISTKDFKERYKKFLSTTSTRDNIQVRKNILNNMVNEKLIFADIARQGFDRDNVYQQRLREIQNQALMDRYARSISADTIIVSDQELYDEFRAYNSKVSARYLYAKSEEEAWKLRNELEMILLS